MGGAGVGGQAPPPQPVVATESVEFRLYSSAYDSKKTEAICDDKKAGAIAKALAAKGFSDVSINGNQGSAKVTPQALDLSKLDMSQIESAIRNAALGFSVLVTNPHKVEVSFSESKSKQELADLQSTLEALAGMRKVFVRSGNISAWCDVTHTSLDEVVQTLESKGIKKSYIRTHEVAVFQVTSEKKDTPVDMGALKDKIANLYGVVSVEDAGEGKIKIVLCRSKGVEGKLNDLAHQSGAKLAKAAQ